MVIEQPREMSALERNTRLWALLSGLGLHVTAIRPEDDENGLVALIVSAEPIPLGLTVCEQPTEPSVSFPVEGDEIVESVGPAESYGLNVVNFPTKR